MRRSSFLLTTIALFVSAPASAYTLLGGQVLGVRDSAVHAQVGYPELDVRYHIPVLKKFEVIPRFTFYYSPGFLGESLEPGIVGDTAGARLKYQLVDKDGFHLALTWDAAIILNYTPEIAFGMRLGFPGGVVMDYDLGDGMTIFGGLNVPVSAMFTPDVIFVIPFEFDMGIELPLTSRMNLSFLLSLGPVARAPKDGDSDVGFSLKGMFGLEFLL